MMAGKSSTKQDSTSLFFQLGRLVGYAVLRIGFMSESLEGEKMGREKGRPMANSLFFSF